MSHYKQVTSFHFELFCCFELKTQHYDSFQFSNLQCHCNLNLTLAKTRVYTTWISNNFCRWNITVSFIAAYIDCDLLCWKIYWNMREIKSKDMILLFAATINGTEQLSFYFVSLNRMTEELFGPLPMNRWGNSHYKNT